MSSFGELIGSISPAARDFGKTLKVILDEPADRAREKLRQAAGERVAASEEGKKIKTEYIRGKLVEYTPHIIIAVIAGLLLVLVVGRR
jgi:hypothetical protein